MMSVSVKEKLQLDLQAKWFSGRCSDMHKKHEHEVKVLLSKYNELSPVVQLKIEDAREYGKGVCPKCKWTCGCFQCTPFEALRHWVKQAKLLQIQRKRCLQVSLSSKPISNTRIRKPHEKHIKSHMKPM